MAVHERAEIQSSLDRLAAERSPAQPAKKHWPFGRLLLVLAAIALWIAIAVLLGRFW